MGKRSSILQHRRGKAYPFKYNTPEDMLGTDALQKYRNNLGAKYDVTDPEQLHEVCEQQLCSRVECSPFLRRPLATLNNVSGRSH